MPDSHILSDQRKATNVTLPVALVAKAKELNINISQACEAGLAVQVKAGREKQWLQENRAAMDAYNEYVEKHGLPLAEYRHF